MTQPLNQHNVESIIEYNNKLSHFVLNLKLGSGVIHSNRKTGSLGLLICFETVVEIYKDYIPENTLKYIPFYKCGQDHLELFFGSIRARGGSNNNPITRQFTSAYKKTISTCRNTRRRTGHTEYHSNK